MIRKILVTNPLFALSVLALTSCGGGGSDSPKDNAVTICPRVINGQSCSPAGSPIVKIVITSPKGVQSLCSGTVISANKVLTAAHCFAFSNIASIDVESDTSSFSVNKFYIHPNLSQSGNALFNDVAIVQTKQSMNLSTLPILLSQTVSGGDKIGITGFGIDENGDLGSLKGGTMIVKDVTINHVSSQFDGKDSNTCNGDSGGPATFTIGDAVAIIGLTSTGIKTDCSTGDVTLFTNLQSQTVLDFITSIEPDIGTL